MIDVIIATCDRINKALDLARSLLETGESINRVIIVDSSTESAAVKLDTNKIYIIKTRHKNQPYQRFVGYKASSAELLVFLDDDMEIVDQTVFTNTYQAFLDNKIVAVAYNFNEKHSDTSLSEVPGTLFNRNHSGKRRIINFLTGYPNPKEGKYGLCGHRGLKPDSGKFIELISGGAFAVRSEILYKEFNFQLFDLYEEKLGKGEDGILGYTLSKKGSIVNYNQLCFQHNDQKNSTYSTDLFSMSKRVAFSRLYLSLEKSRLDKRKYFWAIMHYHYYMFWRFLGLFLSFIIKPNPKRKDVLNGTVNGWRLASHFTYDHNLTRQYYWQNEAQCELS